MKINASLSTEKSKYYNKRNGVKKENILSPPPPPLENKNGLCLIISYCACNNGHASLISPQSLIRDTDNVTSYIIL